MLSLQQSSINKATTSGKLFHCYFQKDPGHVRRNNPKRIRNSSETSNFAIRMAVSSVGQTIIDSDPDSRANSIKSFINYSFELSALLNTGSSICNIYKLFADKFKFFSTCIIIFRVSIQADFSKQDIMSLFYLYFTK